RRVELTMGDSTNGMKGDVYLRFGKLLNLKNEPVKALTYYQKALQYYEKSAGVPHQSLQERQELLLISKSHASINLGNIKTAFDWAKEAVKINPGPEGCLNLIELLLNSNQVQNAIPYFEQLKDFKLNESQGIKLQTLRAQLYLIQQKYELAKDIIGGLIQKLENDSAHHPKVLRDLYYMLSQAHSALGENKESKASYSHYEVYNATIVTALAKIPSSI